MENLNLGKQGKNQVADQVSERIERLIVDGVIKVGQALPSERRLMEKMGCSRSALREGLKILRGRGIIETEHGRGSFVDNLSKTEAVQPLMHLFSSQRKTLYDLLEVRALLEGESARLAALRRVSNCSCNMRRSLRCSAGVGTSAAISRRNKVSPAKAPAVFDTAATQAERMAGVRRGPSACAVGNC